MQFDVAIIGYGPVGALTALSLAEAGLRVLVLERSSEPSRLPRAVGLDGETLRAFQRLGLGEEVESLCQPPRDPNQIAFANSRLEALFSIDVLVFGPNGWPDLLFFDQPEFEVALRKIVAKRERITVRLGREVVAIGQDSHGVSIRSRDGATSGAGEPGGKQEEHRATFAIGCDGASSFVRQAIGVGWESLDYDQDWLVLDITRGPGADLPLTTMQVCDPARLSSYICVKDPNRRWEFQLLEGESREEMLAPEKIRELLKPWTAPEHYEIRRAAVYQFHAAIAGAWRVGRVLLAGDAAHQTPPFLGQGLNAGFRDAVNLGWKIPLVLAQVCDDDLLDTYAQERDAHARELVERAVSVGKLMETLAAREAGLPDPHPPDSIKIDMGGRIVPPMLGGVLVADQLGGDSRVGDLLWQPTLRRRDGIEERLDDYLGKSFCVVGRRASDLQLGPNARTILERLGGRVVALEGYEVVEGRIDALFESHSAAVVRPDRYIYGVVDDEWDLDRLLFELGRALSLVDFDDSIGADGSIRTRTPGF
jgi:3-(3-hydroxy-phenyl)propionate hydroxylase